MMRAKKMLDKYSVVENDGWTYRRTTQSQMRGKDENVWEKVRKVNKEGVVGR